MFKQKAPHLRMSRGPHAMLLNRSYQYPWVWVKIKPPFTRVPFWVITHFWEDASFWNALSLNLERARLGADVFGSERQPCLRADVFGSERQPRLGADVFVSAPCLGPLCGSCETSARPLRDLPFPPFCLPASSVSLISWSLDHAPGSSVRPSPPLTKLHVRLGRAWLQ